MREAPHRAVARRIAGILAGGLLLAGPAACGAGPGGGGGAKVDSTRSDPRDTGEAESSVADTAATTDSPSGEDPGPDLPGTDPRPGDACEDEDLSEDPDGLGSACAAPPLDPAPCTAGVAAWLPAGPFATVGAAVAAAGDGEVVAVCPGTWSEVLIVAPGRELTIRGYGTETTVLDGGGRGSVVRSTGAGTLVLADLALVGGDAREGGAVAVEAGALRTCCVRMEGNAADDGGALALEGGVPWAGWRDTFRANEARRSGGAVYAHEGAVRVSRGTFESNLASNGGGALSLDGSGGVVIWDTRFVANEGGEEGGGGILFGGHEPQAMELHRVTFERNTAQNGGAVYVTGFGAAQVYVDAARFEGNVAEMRGGAVALAGWDALEVQVMGSTFRGNESGLLGGAVYLGGWGLASWAMEGSLVEGNQSPDGGGFASEPAAGDEAEIEIEVTGGGVVGNLSARGGGLRLDVSTEVRVTDSDWGEGATDNLPNDCVDCPAFGADTSFDCHGRHCSIRE